MNRLLIYGFGYTAAHLANRYAGKDLQIIGTTRNRQKVNQSNKFVSIIENNDLNFLLQKNKDEITHIMISAPPSDSGDSFFFNYQDYISEMKNLKWIGYLSATNVYGDHRGEYVDESSKTNPTTQKGKNRLLAEKQWLAKCREKKLPIHIFRISGIYGPKRNNLERIRNGTIRNIVKSNQFFSRIYIDDLISVLYSSMVNPNPMSIYNVADNCPSSSTDVIDFVCKSMNVVIPNKIQYDSLDDNFKMQSFYSENKKIDNTFMKKNLNINLDYPTFREGYKKILNYE